FEWEARCEQAVYMNAIPATGAFTMSVHALAGDAVVAVSPESPPVVLHGAVTDFGTLVLSPCGAACPPPD
ncbi:MAG TPA: hypothetical protein VHN14_11230, partial [Kofleriaceae bacterium]|nr:hypothetical protein [Kofleriaceae bacterium]